MARSAPGISPPPRQFSELAFARRPRVGQPHPRTRTPKPVSVDDGRESRDAPLVSDSREQSPGGRRVDSRPLLRSVRFPLEDSTMSPDLAVNAGRPSSSCELTSAADYPGMSSRLTGASFGPQDHGHMGEHGSLHCVALGRTACLRRRIPTAHVVDSPVPSERRMTRSSRLRIGLCTHRRPPGGTRRTPRAAAFKLGSRLRLGERSPSFLRALSSPDRPRVSLHASSGSTRPAEYRPH